MNDSFCSDISRLRPALLVLSFCGLLLGLSIYRAAQGDEASQGPPSDRVTDVDRQFWSFQKLVRPNIPNVGALQRSRTPIDAFISSRLEGQGLSMSADADRLTLLRRVYLDLAGISPSPEVAAEFLADDSPQAYENLVDLLLASPHFGERWGRHWLDVAGYVDTVGFDVDVDLVIVSERKWLYRDYVIQSFNSDKPYDRFLHEQLAGDELVDWRHVPKFTDEIRESLVATGYLRNAADFTHEEVGNIPQNHFGIVHDTLEIVSSSVLGLTLNCARCHNHKFDPLPQLDYYRLMAALTPAYNPNEWLIVIQYDKKLPDRTLADVSLADRAEIESHNAEIDRQIDELSKKLTELRRPFREKLLEQKLAAIPEPIRNDTKTAVSLAADKRDKVQAYLADKFAGHFKATDDEVAKALDSDAKAAAAEMTAQTNTLTSQKKSFGKIQALFDVGTPPVTRLLIRGNYETPGDEVLPGYLRVLSDNDSSANMQSTQPSYGGTTGRRLELARWLTASGTRAEGLVSRVMVNRVWQHLFQSGIVPTPENLGMGGTPPTHPELLEWLSKEFVQSGWSMKSLIRQIVCSTVYRQSSDRIESTPGEGGVAHDPVKIDPDNRLLWRMPLKRLDSEAIRDCILSACGTMDSTIGGAPVMLEGKPDGMIVVAEKQLPTPTAKWRRSVYLLSRRAFPLSELAVFDQPVIATNCSERSRSAVPLQSLALLNGAFLWDQAEQMSTQLEQRSENSRSDEQSLVQSIRDAFQRAMVRQPTPKEMEQSIQFLRHQSELYRGKGLESQSASHKALMHLCHSLLNTSEFLYTP